MKKEILSNAALLAALSLPLAGTALGAPKWAKKGDVIEKCAGVAKKGQNDCGANGHACGGKAAKDNDPKEWVYVPSGVCKKIGGKVAGTKKI
jgi:uncharacterized membrane protein